MLTPAKAITAGALVFAIGGVLLTAQPFDQRGDSVPGAETPIATPVEVTGRFVQARKGKVTAEGGDETVLPGASEIFTIRGSVTSSDPRLSGGYTYMNSWRWFVDNGVETLEAVVSACAEDPDCDTPGLNFVQNATSIENDQGAWRMRPRLGAYMATDLLPWAEETFIEVYDGEGTYEGLVAVLERTATGITDGTFFGFILDARVLPEPPENASTK